MVHQIAELGAQEFGQLREAILHDRRQMLIITNLAQDTQFLLRVLQVSLRLRGVIVIGVDLSSQALRHGFQFVNPHVVRRVDVERFPLKFVEAIEKNRDL